MDAGSYTFTDPKDSQITGLGLAYEAYAGQYYSPYVDLVPATLSFSPLEPLALYTEPTTITLKGVVRNGGNTDAYNVPVQFWAGEPSQPVGEVQVIAMLPARSLARVSVPWVGALSDTYRAGVTVDPENLVPEPNEENNALASDLQMDLATVDLGFSPALPFAPPGEQVRVTLTAKVYNGGNTDLVDVPVRFWVGDIEQPIGEVQIATCLARSISTVSIRWRYAASGVYTIGATVDADDWYSEMDEGNNDFDSTLLVVGQRRYLPFAARAY